MVESFKAALLQLRELGLNGCEIWQILWRLGLLGVLDHARFIHDESCACASSADAGETGEKNTVGLGGFLIEVADERDGDALLLRPRFLRKWAVHAHADDFRIEARVAADALRHVAKFLCAYAGEREREEQDDGVLFAEVGGKRHVLEAVGVFAFECEVGGLGSDGDRHSVIWLVVFKIGGRLVCALVPLSKAGLSAPLLPRFRPPRLEYSP